MLLYVGGHAHSIAGDPARIDGPRCFSAAHYPPKHVDPARTRVLLDSGAFSDVMDDQRLTFDAALDRQLAWEETAARVWDAPFTSHAIAAYDRLVDEQYIDGRRHKRRWTVDAAAAAVDETVAAAAYLAGQRERLVPRRLVLNMQGVTAEQYADCAARVLAYAAPDDWLGFGGWCILGRYTSWLPEFNRTLELVLPLVAAAGIRRVHLYGVLYLPALGVYQYQCDRFGLEPSTDSAAPVKQAIGRDPVKSGRRRADWRENVAYWHETLATLRATPHYRAWPVQPELFQLAS